MPARMRRSGNNTTTGTTIATAPAPWRNAFYAGWLDQSLDLPFLREYDAYSKNEQLGYLKSIDPDSRLPNP